MTPHGPTLDFAALCAEQPLNWCPRCGERTLQPHRGRAVHCTSCDFLYYHNNAAAAGVVVRCGEHVLMIERGQAPSSGLLDVPGGFADYGETLEQTALRETREEVGIALDEVRYLASFPNVYRYRDMIYQTCDVYFEARVDTRPDVVAADDAAACHWCIPAELAPEQLAFDSVRALVARLCTP